MTAYRIARPTVSIGDTRIPGRTKAFLVARLDIKSAGNDRRVAGARQGEKPPAEQFAGHSVQFTEALSWTYRATDFDVTLPSEEVYELRPHFFRPFVLNFRTFAIARFRSSAVIPSQRAAAPDLPSSFMSTLAAVAFPPSLPRAAAAGFGSELDFLLLISSKSMPTGWVRANPVSTRYSVPSARDIHKKNR